MSSSLLSLFRENVTYWRSRETTLSRKSSQTSGTVFSRASLWSRITLRKQNKARFRYQPSMCHNVKGGQGVSHLGKGSHLSGIPYISVAKFKLKLQLCTRLVIYFTFGSLLNADHGSIRRLGESTK